MGFILKVSSFDLQIFVHPGISQITPPGSAPLLTHLSLHCAAAGTVDLQTNAWQTICIYRPDSLKPASDLQDRTGRIGSEEKRGLSSTHLSKRLRLKITLAEARKNDRHFQEWNKESRWKPVLGTIGLDNELG